MPRLLTDKELEEILTKLETLEEGDPEEAHMQADNILLGALVTMGYSDIATKFVNRSDTIGFWYV